jgi:hypothetical protein
MGVKIWSTKALDRRDWSKISLCEVAKALQKLQTHGVGESAKMLKYYLLTAFGSRFWGILFVCTDNPRYLTSLLQRLLLLRRFPSQISR